MTYTIDDRKKYRKFSTLWITVKERIFKNLEASEDEYKGEFVVEVVELKATVKGNKSRFLNWGNHFKSL